MYNLTFVIILHLSFGFIRRMPTTRCRPCDNTELHVIRFVFSLLSVCGDWRVWERSFQSADII